MNRPEIPPGFRQVRNEHLLQEREHDAYKMKGKLPEPSACPECGAVFHHGRWQWGVAPETAHLETCPACLRLRDRYPAGFLTLHGDFFLSHRDEVLHLARNHERREREEHPLKRIMDVEERDGSVLVTTTDIHLARGMGVALHHAYQGELEFHYNQEQNLLRVDWSR